MPGPPYPHPPFNGLSGHVTGSQSCDRISSNQSAKKDYMLAGIRITKRSVCAVTTVTGPSSSRVRWRAMSTTIRYDEAKRCDHTTYDLCRYKGERCHGY
jgi:hypothetical protein